MARKGSQTAGLTLAPGAENDAAVDLVRLSPRLKTLLELALPGEPLWDLCCDHGFLGLRGLQEGRFPEVHFVDQVPGIIRKLRALLEEKGFPEAAANAHLTAAEKISKPLQGTVVIAGVGGERIHQILGDLQTQDLLQAKRLVLSPHKDEDVFEKEFKKVFETQWLLEPPREIRESGRIRPIWVANRISL